jgi:hypothetical protein
MEENRSLSNAIDLLARNGVALKMTTGYGDACGGYGWSTVYYVTAIMQREYCVKCFNKTGEDYSDHAHPFNNHRYDVRQSEVLSGTYIGSDHLTDALYQLINETK